MEIVAITDKGCGEYTFLVKTQHGVQLVNGTQMWGIDKLMTDDVPTVEEYRELNKREMRSK